MRKLARLALVIGGARSGKSAFAQALATSKGKEVCYIATAEAGDEEMRERIRRHRSNRPREWVTLELAGGTRLEDSPPGDCVAIFDCLTIFLSNLMGELGLLHLEGTAGGFPERELEKRAEGIAGRALSFLLDLRERCEFLIVVTNEVGMGLVPPSRSARLFRDLSGVLNRRLAEMADEVYLVMAGIPVCLKGSAGSTYG